jgi:hypothetical protein
MDAPPSGDYPFTVEGENRLRFVGKTRYGKDQAAIIDLHFTNLLRPSPEAMRRDGAYLELRAQGMGLDIRVSGEGKGRVLVALDDGRILQNHTTVRQTLKAEMAKTNGIKTPVDGPLSLQVESETQLQVESVGQPSR